MIAVYIDNTLEKLNSEIRYSVDFIFKTLGYEFKYISRIEQLLHRDILLLYGNLEPSLTEAYYLVMHKIMLYIPCDQELFISGSLQGRDLKTWQKSMKLDNTVPLLSFHDFESPIKCYNGEDLNYTSFKFDPIGNVYYRLRNNESTTSEFNNNPDNDAATENSLLPAVNYYCWLIERCLIDAVQNKPHFYLIKKDYWPRGEMGAFAVSHNVDKLRKWNTKKIMKSTYEDLLLFYKIKYLFENLISKIKYITTNIEEYWNFDLIREIEAKYKVKSTYFWGTEAEMEEDVDYRLSSKDVADEITLLQESAHEIALLASRKSFNNDILKRQKQKIAQITLREKIGMRQNGYLYDAKVTDELILKQNFVYDSSRISLYTPGFFNGIGFPYHSFLESKNKGGNGFHNSSYLQIPLSFSDEQLLLSRTKIISREDAAQLISDLLDSIKLTNGLLAFNFSVANFTELDYDEELFSDLLSRISSLNFFQATFLEIADWWRRRENLEINEYEDTIDLYFPERIEHFTLTLYGKVEIKEIIGIEADIDQNKIRFKNVLPDKKVQIVLNTKAG